MLVKFKSFKDVKQFVFFTQSKDYEIKLGSTDGKYWVDGKSILGIFSLDTDNPLVLQVPDEKEEEFTQWKA